MALSTDEAGKRTALRSVAVQPLSSTRIHHLQLLSKPAPPPVLALQSSGPHAKRPTSGLLLRFQHVWTANAWLLLTVGMFCWLGRMSAAAAAASSPDPSSSKRLEGERDSYLTPSNLGGELYIVLVSLPMLDKVLPLKHLAEELLSRGCRVGFALPENCRHWVSDLEGLEFISLGHIVGKGRASYLDLSELKTLGVYESYAATLRFYASFQRPMFSALVEDLEDDRPALVVLDRYTFAGLDACHRLQLPYVVNDPHLLLDMDSPPAYTSAPFSNLTMHTTSVLERCLNSYYRLRFRLGLVHVFKEINSVRSEHGLAPIESKHQMHGLQLVLVNSVFGLDEARPLAPHFRMVGLLQSRQLQADKAVAMASTASSRVPEALSTWLLAPDAQHRPLIFVSFQADVPLAPEFVTTIMNALETVDARLLWKITLQEQAVFDLRSRPRESVLFLGEEVDDAAVLAQAPSVALLISAGDFQTVQEALVAGVPVLGIPFSAEHLEGVNAVVRAGAGLQLDATSFSEAGVGTAVRRLLDTEHERFQTEAEHVGELIKTGGGVQRAADEVLAVAEFGSRHLLPMCNVQPLYKTYLVDVYLIYGAILCGAAIILRTFVSLVLSIFQPLIPPLVPMDDMLGHENGDADDLRRNNGGAHVEVHGKKTQ